MDGGDWAALLFGLALVVGVLVHKVTCLICAQHRQDRRDFRQWRKLAERDRHPSMGPQ